jgi:eukaryotic-like serine/threonine-protein kinase
MGRWVAGRQAVEPMLSEVASVHAGELVAGKYRLEALLGRGGMGAVYCARHVLTGRRFAIKLLSRELTGDAGAEERFMREAMLASSIQHPAIVEVYDVGRDRGVPYMVMKLLQGETLGQRLLRGPLAPEPAIALLMPVIDGIAAAHAHGIVHRDLKPDNVLIEREGEREHPRVLDFGISKLLGGDARRPAITRPGTIVGTPEYMAPEQVRGERELDARCDVYSLGVILYEMLTGALPFAGKEVPALLLAIADGTAAPGIRTRSPELPDVLEAVVARAMEPRRELRYADAAELGRALLALELVRASQLSVARLASRPSLRSTARASGTQRLPSQPSRWAKPLSTPANARASVARRDSASAAHGAGPRSSADSANTHAAIPSTPVVELDTRRTLPPSSTLYVGAALGAIALIALIAIAVLPSSRRSVPLEAPAAVLVPAPASAPAPVRVPVAPGLAPAAVSAPPPPSTPALPPREHSPVEAPGERRRRATRLSRSKQDAAVPAFEPPPGHGSNSRVDMPSLTREILDPFE